MEAPTEASAGTQQQEGPVFKAYVDFKFVRDNAELIAQNCVNRGAAVDPNRVVQLYEQFVSLQQETDRVRAARNENSSAMKASRAEGLGGVGVWLVYGQLLAEGRAGGQQRRQRGYRVRYNRGACLRMSPWVPAPRLPNTLSLPPTAPNFLLVLQPVKTPSLHPPAPRAPTNTIYTCTAAAAAAAGQAGAREAR